MYTETPVSPNLLYLASLPLRWSQQRRKPSEISNLRDSVFFAGFLWHICWQPPVVQFPLAPEIYLLPDQTQGYFLGKEKELEKKSRILSRSQPILVGEKKRWARREGQYQGAGRLGVGSRRRVGEQAQGDTSSSFSSASSSPPSPPLSRSLFKA